MRAFQFCWLNKNARKALSIADHACVLEQGRIVKQGTGSEIAADEKHYQCVSRRKKIKLRGIEQMEKLLQEMMAALDVRNLRTMLDG